MSEPPTSFDPRYEILDKLHEGGMGAIYRARHRLLGAVRVVKVLRPELADSEELRERFVREARAATELDHPNIARLYDFSVDADGRFYMVMEHIRGVNLRELCQLGGVPPLSLALEIGRQGLIALAYLHRRHYVHRDISPENLMLTADADGRPLVKLIDLGIAKQLEGAARLTSTGTFLGKVHYASPEQFSATASLDARSDLYSFGILLYELLTAQRPIEGPDLSSLVSGHLFRAPTPFAESDPAGRVPGPLRDLVLGALEKDPAARPPDADAFRAGLERLARELPAAHSPALEQSFAALETQLSRRGRGFAAPAPERQPLAPESPRGASAADEPPLPETVVGGEVATRSGAFDRTSSVARPAPAGGALARARRPVVAAAAALGLVVAAAVILALWLRRPAGPERAPSAPPPTGVLWVDARPWAEVVEVRAADGAPLPLPVERSTPLWLELPAGPYQIRLRHPSQGAARTLEARVEAGAAPARLEAIFLDDGAQRFLAEALP